MVDIAAPSIDVIIKTVEVTNVRSVRNFDMKLTTKKSKKITNYS